jgi:hypothetical protein
MTNYRPATAADIGRDDVEFLSSTFASKVGTLFQLFGEHLAAPGCEPGRSYRDSQLRLWPYARVPILPEDCANNVPIEPQMSQSNEPVLTIRRKLEAGGYAEPEQAIYLDGRYYSTEWIKSGVGCLPQQVEIVK